MKMNKLVCVFPKDKTTSFLAEIYDFLKTQDNTVCYHLDTNDDIVQTQKVKDELEKLDDDSFFIFLGHGASHTVYGSPNKDIKTSFLTKDEIEKFECKVCSISCRSAELLDKKSTSIGFGNIPTDYDIDVLATREHDVNYLRNIDKEDIEYFKSIFAEIILSTFKQWFSSKDLSMSKLNSLFRLFINKRICELLLNKEVKNYRDIAYILYDLKDELNYTSL